MLTKGLKTEIRWLTLAVLAAVIVGFSLDAIMACIVVALLFVIARIFYRMAALESWVASARRREPPADDFSGIWGEIADDVRLLRKRYEKDKLRLQAVVSRVQEMTSALSDAVILVDSLDNIEWWNRSANMLFSFRDIDRGHRLINFIRNPRFVSYFEGQDYSEALETVSLLREGQHLAFFVHPFGQGEKLVVVRDITHIKRLEKMRKDFVSNVSHELRTPLTVIKGYIETLIDSPSTSDLVKKCLGQMHHQSDRMTALVNDLISLSRLETEDTESKQESVALAPALKAIVEEAKSLASENHIFHFSVEDNVAVLGNSRELHSAFSNIIYNAVKYSPDGGDIYISGKFEQGDLVVRVRDSGLGIDPKHIPRLTERFYRVDEGRSSDMGGTGLGLAIVKHVLLRHNAELKISSYLGRGSTFSCRFPRSRIQLDVKEPLQAS